MLEDYPEILSVPQVAEALNISLAAAYTLVNEHRLGCIRIGRKIKVPKYCLEEFINSARENVML